MPLINGTELELDEVTKSFGGVKAIDAVSLSCAPGRIVSLIGPNGAGKTTLFNMISGFLKPDAGRIRFGKRDIVGLAPHLIARTGIGRLFQDGRVFPKLSVLDNVLVARRNQPGENPLLGFFAPQRVAVAERENKNKALKQLEVVGLVEMAEQLGESLSHGQQKLLAIARLLHSESVLFLLDEPTAGVSPEVIEQIRRVVRQLANEGRTVVVIEHNLGFVTSLSDWVYLLDDGQVAAFGTPHEVFADRVLHEAYLGV